MNTRWLFLCCLLATPVFGQEAPSRPIATALQPFVDQNKLAGAVTLVANKDRVLSLETVGYENVAAKKPMAKDSIFWIASMSKPITAVGLMLLVDEGKVNLDDPVAKYLPELKDIWVTAEKDAGHILLKRPQNVMTVRMLSNHTSGMPFSSALEVPTLDMVSLKDAVRSYAITPLLSEPGTKYLYSNCGINTMGRIIEVVSGQSYEEFMDKRLFWPLGMRDTTFWPSDEQLTRLASTYKPNATKDGLEEINISYLTYPLNQKIRKPMPAGGLFSTASDVATFCQMVLNGGEWNGKRYLSAASVAEMTKRQTPETMPQNQGIGWATGPDFFGHGGALSTNMSVDTKRGLVTVFLVQHAGFPGDGNKSQGVFKQLADKLYAPK